MTDRERLIELKINFVENFDCGDCKPSNNKCRKCLSEKEADYLLEHGVIVPPCKVGTRHNKLTFISVDEEKTKEKHRTYNSTKEPCCVFLKRHYNEAINIIQKWSDENPQMTLLEYLKKVFPNVRIGDDGTPSMCPSDLGLEQEVFCTYNCQKC